MSHVSKFCALLAMSSLTVLGLRADPVTVQEVGVGANETVFINSTGPNGLGNNLHVYAGVLDLKVDGVATTGFCIDPWHWSGSGPMSYQTEDLSLAPKATISGMGSSAAKQIEQLWAQYYTPSISNVNAAALQIEIWTIVDNAVYGGTNFKLDSVDSSSSAVMTEISTMANFLTTNPNAVTADLIAVTGPGQDYVIARVPDGGVTLSMLGLGLVGLLAFRRKTAKN
ncbi:MAG TPA: VPDSG-CTERM sorting domain-containing protein [Candidatus Didemnitutus sp.]|nr:VPDSG-CTERM sorting domain-containing protein [Candidatus Didemnitutus sp.]